VAGGLVCQVFSSFFLLFFPLDLQEVSLPGGVHVRPVDPLLVRLRNVSCAQRDLIHYFVDYSKQKNESKEEERRKRKQEGKKKKRGGGITFHFEPRADLHELDLVVSVLLIHVVSEADEVMRVGEGHHTLALWLWDRKQELEDVLDPRPERGAEVVKNQVWVLLRDGSTVLNIVPQPHIVQAEVGGGPVREV